MNYEENFGMTDKEFQTIIQVLRRVMGPDNLLLSMPKLDQLCFKCRIPMCSVDVDVTETYYQYFHCGHEELKL
jgi:hypothetical protein